MLKQLERGFATIPLPGIDVPFHSRYLWAGVMPFRAYLSKKINPMHLDPDMLIGKYIPNLIAKPFAVSKEYAHVICDQTSLPRLDKVLKKWDQESWATYQFASPVRWIETQDRLFTQFQFERFIELGPSPTLMGMATRTLKAKYDTSDDSVSRMRTILITAAAPAPVAAAAPVSGPVASIEDVPIKALEILTVVVAQKLKKRVDEIPLSKSIKDLVGGKSTLQNEILGDLQQEFASASERVKNFLSKSLPNGLISRVIGGKMPGGFNVSAMKTHLAKAWGPSPKTWLDGIISIYAQHAGISLAAPAAGAAGGSAGGVTINSEEFLKFQADQQRFAAQHVELYMRYLGRDSRAGEIAFDQEKATSTALQAKLDSITTQRQV
ncbi:hypothetical protein C0992_009428 [Termitomyces sp. T32_za158]|nr:hypothetical protein C0992_009428 [Termitomyces sp. T32_za158]